MSTTLEIMRVFQEIFHNLKISVKFISVPNLIKIQNI